MSKPIRVLYWGMSSNIGGIESFIMNVYRNIDRQKVQIDFITSHDHDKIAFEDEIEAMGGKVYRVMYSESESLIKSRTSLDKFFKEHKEYAAVHIHANFPYVFPLKYAKKAGIPVRIIHSHNSNGNVNNSSGIRKIVNKLRDMQIEKQIKKYPTHYFACSELAADYMFPGRDYQWIKNGIDLKKYSFDEEVRKEVRDELGVEDDCQLLGFIGRLRYQKNPYFIVDIFREYQKLNINSKLVIAGIGEWETGVKEAAKDLIDSGKALFLGKRTDAERLYQGMDAFLLPSFYEGLPVVLVEAQTAGLPCFTSNFVTKQIDVTNLINYYSLSDNAKLWAEKIYKSLGNYKRKSYRSQLETQGFGIENVAKALEEFYIFEKSKESLVNE